MLKIPEEAFVFLGGTCNGSTWREHLQAFAPKVVMCNPVVPDWTPEDAILEERAKEQAMVNVFVITPKMTGIYSIAELCVRAAAQPGQGLFVAFLKEDEGVVFSEAQWKSVQATIKLLESSYDFHRYDSLETLGTALNNHPWLNREKPQQEAWRPTIANKNQ